MAPPLWPFKTTEPRSESCLWPACDPRLPGLIPTPSLRLHWPSPLYSSLAGAGVRMEPCPRGPLWLGWQRSDQGAWSLPARSPGRARVTPAPLPFHVLQSWSLSFLFPKLLSFSEKRTESFWLRREGMHCALNLEVGGATRVPAARAFRALTRPAATSA